MSARLLKHARARLKERCDVHISLDRCWALSEHLRRRLDEAIAYCDNGAPVFAVTLNGKQVYAVWSPQEEMICTFLDDLGRRQRAQVDFLTFGRTTSSCEPPVLGPRTGPAGSAGEGATRASSPARFGGGA
jgi:hypothetical protein